MFIIGLEYSGCSRDSESEREREKDGGYDTWKRVKSRDWLSYARNDPFVVTLLDKKEFCASHICTRKCDGCDACKIREGRDYFIATIMTAGRYILFTELDFDSRINLTVLPSCNAQQYVNSLNCLTNFKEIRRTIQGVSVFLHRYDIFISYIHKHTHTHTHRHLFILLS